MSIYFFNSRQLSITNNPENLIKHISQIYVKIKKHISAARDTRRKGALPFTVYSVSRSILFGIDTPSRSVSFS